ncbi:MAG: RNA-binding domain-containing protein [Candidatus Nitrosopelagicus sp.]|nr:RNA-binding domain-containing protein [Candidatus Nitrosopelagicus sp.]
MNQKTTIQIFCTINPSEDPDKVKTAMNNIFPDVELEISDTEISGKTNNFSVLSQISKSIHEKNVKNTYQRILKKNNDGESTWFYLNKQAAFVNTVALCSEANESSLGPIKIILRSNNIEQVIDSVTN